MNTLGRLDSYLSSLGVHSHYHVLSVTSHKSVSPTTSATASSVVSPSPSRPKRQLSSLPPASRRTRDDTRRRPPTSSSIKLPPPSTPVLLRVALGLWSILLAFWRSLVGDTRAGRVLRRKRRGTITRGIHRDGVYRDSHEGPECQTRLTSVSSVTGVTSDEGSASDGDAASDGEDSTTRAIVGGDNIDSSSNELPSGLRGSPSSTDSTFSFRLRSAQRKNLVSISDAYESKTPPLQLDHLFPSPKPGPTPYQRQPLPTSILSNPTQQQARLLPNPMATSLLDPSVPAIPHRTITPHSTPELRMHQTPFHLQKTLILDLDETLIHSTSRPLGNASAGGGLLGLSSGLFGGRRSRRGEGHTIEVVLNGRSTTYHVYKRPYVDFFLKKVASWYTLVIFTASMPEYADPVIDWLDNGRGLFAKKLYRDSCHLQPNGSYIKDLAIVEADLGRVCFMDNSPISYSWNKANALPIEGWTSDPYDEALLQSIPVLDSLRFVNDVRRILGIRGFS